MIQRDALIALRERASKVVEELREASCELQRVAWGRSDGGQEWTLSSLLADRAAEIIEDLAALSTDTDPSLERVEAMRAELPEDLRGDDVAHGIRMLRIGYEAQRDREIAWGRALRLMLPFVDRAAREGFEWMKASDSPRMDGVEIYVAVAKALGCEPDDAAMEAMHAQGKADIRALTNEGAGSC